ncbi:MAG: DUF6489 family protein [Gammaproteobacteria bacterium]|nr:DUF6489 family protein [Gammaproteobacteria bacterium]
MKLNIEIDTTPEELRKFLGLPDVQPVQQELMEKAREKILAAMDNYDPIKLMSALLPEGMRSVEEMQKAFWGLTGVGKDQKKDD